MVIARRNHSTYESVLLLLLLFSQVCSLVGYDTIHAGESLPGNQTIVSKSVVFEMGFFKPGNSLNYYIGIWYKNTSNQTVVWVANREKPVPDPSFSSLKILENGNLTLLTGSKTVVWSSNSNSRLSNSTIGVLLDNGNFVIRDKFNSSVVIWQSFDHPTNTWLPGGKIGYNRITKEKIILTSWSDLDDPTPGMYSLEMELHGTISLLLKGNGTIYCRGYWGGSYFKDYHFREWSKLSIVANFYLVTNGDETYFTYADIQPNAFTRLTIDTFGYLNQYVRVVEELREWDLYSWIGEPRSSLSCGYNSVFNMNGKTCSCLEGFEAENKKCWRESRYWCVRKTPLQCTNGGNDTSNDTFSVARELSFPMVSESIAAQNTEECRLACLSNCSCTAYAYGYDDICFIWINDLYDLYSRSPDEIGPYLNLRMAASPLLEIKATNRETIYWIVIPILVGLFSFLGVVLVLLRRRYLTSAYETVEDSLVLYRYHALKFATKNFSEKLGEGGFGSVFKGTLSNSTSIAVKKLKSLQQAEKQFRAEVRTIGTIQHVNLVRLRGFCAESSRRFLVYDYMPKGSLESILFKKSQNILDWKMRYQIVIGVARGLHYLHEECRDCIIHCDVKPENILLDEEYNPKLADFGLAKLLGRDFSRVLTTMRGTIGYLAPEWISGTAITPKADVYSYGMLLFELISGRRNCSEELEEGMEHYFPFRVSNSLRLGEDILPLLDCRLEGNADKEELTRACKVACWCIQDDEKNRPNMSQVVHILMGVIEVGLAPVPLLFQRLVGISTEVMNHQETNSGSSQLLSTVDEPNAKYFSFST